MTDATNPRARLDAALGEMRDANDGPGSHEQITSAATVVCAEALALLVAAHLPHLPAHDPEPVEPPVRSVVLVYGEAWQRIGNYWYVAGGEKDYTWAEICRRGTPTVIYTPKENNND